MPKKWRNRWAAIVVCATWSTTAVAQAPLVLPTPAEPRLPQPRPPVPPPAPDLDLRPPTRQPAPTPPDVLRFFIREVVIEGATAFDAATLQALAAPIVGREATFADIAATAERIEAHYRSSGYILTRVVVPPQRIRDGVVTIRVVEGFISRVIIEGVNAPTQALLAERLQVVTEQRPISLAVLERALLLAGDTPGVRVNGVLRPGENLGAAELVVTATLKNLEGVVGASNRGSPYAGPWSGTGEVSVNSALERGERITLGLTLTPDLHEQRVAYFRYLEPVGKDGLNLGVEAQYSTGEPGRTLRPFDVQSRSWRLGWRAAYPLIRSRRENLIIDGGVAWHETAVDVRHERFTRDSYSFADVRLTYSEYGAFLAGGSLAGIGLTRGLGIGGSETGDAFLSRSDAVPTFTKLTSEMRRQQPLFGPFSANALLLGQYSFGPLFSTEEMALGGSRVARGYDPAEATGRHGIGGAFELRHGETALDGWQAYGFYDRGRVWKNTEGVKGSPQLASAGGGIRFRFNDAFFGTLELARPLARPPDAADDQRPWRLYLDLSAPF